MRLFATFDFVDEASSRLCKIAHPARNEPFPPQMLLLVRPGWPFSGSDADKDADVSARILVADGFIQDLRGRVVLPGALVYEN